jgi:serine/threonine-protein kinase RsbW
VTDATGRGGKTTVELRLDARAENLVLARLALAGVAAHAGASREVVSDLKLAVTEACTNVIKHAYGDSGEPGVVVVRYTVARGMLSVEVEDAGCGFEATALPEGPAENGAGNGMGLTIIRVLTDELSIESADPGTRLTFVKRFSPES